MSEEMEVRDIRGDVVFFSKDHQGVSVWLGNGLVAHVHDDDTDDHLRALFANPGQRAVAIARLNRIIDALEWAPPAFAEFAE